MNNQVLSKKMNIILKKMGCSKTKFLEMCKFFDPAISKPTILNLINGTGKRLPSVETLSIIIKVCHTYGKGDLKRLTFDYLLNDEVTELTSEHLETYHEFGLSTDTLNFFHIENTIGLYERDTMKGVNEFIPNVRRSFFTQVSVANTLVEILKRIKWLDYDNIDRTELIAQISGYLNRDYILFTLKQNKCLLPFLKDLEKEKNIDKIIEILNNMSLTLHEMYSSSKYLLIDSINEYYQDKEGNLYKYEEIELTDEEKKEIKSLRIKIQKELEEDKRKSDIRRENKERKEKNKNEEIRNK